ncbi:hypothetical protein [Hyphococcus sp.]|jgi:hypothetical protein|uniref:hypothetical protein n=1 Tax=Hyphococcus sp. TaxID=2038636 RepID=UPI003D09F916
MMRIVPGLLATAILTGGCETVATQTPAVLERADAETLDRVKSVLAGAVGRATIELGAGDLTQSSTVSVLPPPLSPREDRSMAAPVLFDIMLMGEDCYLVRRDSGESFRLPVACRAAQ